METEKNATNIRVIRDMRFEIRRIDAKIAELNRRKLTCQCIIERNKRQMKSNDDERKRQIEEAWREYDRRSLNNEREYE